MQQDDGCMGQCAWLFYCWWCHFLTTDFGMASLPSVVSTCDGVSCSVTALCTSVHVCPCLGSLAVLCRHVLSLAWQHFWFVLLLWPGHWPLACSLITASRLHIRPHLAEVFRVFACLTIRSEFCSGGYLSPARELGANGTLG